MGTGEKVRDSAETVNLDSAHGQGAVEKKKQNDGEQPVLGVNFNSCT